MKSIKAPRGIILLFMLLASYFALAFLEAPLIPSFSITSALYIMCIILPELVRNIRILRLSAWIYCATQFMPLLLSIIAPHTPAVDRTLTCIFSAGFCLYPIPVYLLWVRKELDFWPRLIVLTTMIIFAILHICCFFMWFFFRGWDTLNI